VIGHYLFTVETVSLHGESEVDGLRLKPWLDELTGVFIMGND